MATNPLPENQAGDVVVERYNVLFDNPSYCTLLNLGYAGKPIGPPADAEAAIKAILRDRTPRTIFATPLSKVVTKKLTPQFLGAARREQVAWRRRLEDVFGSPRLMQRYFEPNNPQIKHPLVRQLELTGIMIVEGRHVFPDRWPKLDPPGSSGPKPRPRIVVGDRYKRLVVLELLSGGRVLCECQCERRTKHIVERHHLTSKRTTSCGCARREQEARHQNRKGRRAR